jgi:glucose/arabinose dehydrogenase
MNKRLKIVVLITALALALTACSSAAQSTSSQGTFQPGQMQGTPPAGAPQAVNPGTTNSTETAATEVATNAATEIPSVEATSEPTTIATPVSVDLTVISAIGCVAKPSESAAFAGYLKTGEILSALGRNSSNTFYLINNPSDAGQTCWVWNNYVLINGISSDLPVME